MALSLAQLQTSVYFGANYEHAEDCTYWLPSENPDVDAGAPVRGILRRMRSGARYEDDAGAVASEGTAVLNADQVTVTSGEPDEFGYLQDANGQLWLIDEILLETAVWYKVHLVKHSLDHYGGVEAQQ